MAALIDTIKEVGTALGAVDDAKRTVLVRSLVQLVDKLTERITSVMGINAHFNEFGPVMDKQLLAVEKRTEKATDEIMAVAEALTTDIASLPADSKEKIQKHINALFEISGFQDLVAQHVNEIKMRMDELKKDMDELEEVFTSFTSDNPAAAQAKARATNNVRLTNKLLNGPTTDV